MYRMIDLNKVENLKIVVENLEIDGEITEVDNLGKIFIKVPVTSHCVSGEINKKGFIIFFYEGKKYVVGGKVHCQSPHKIIFIPETDIEEERRKDIRVETPAIPVEISFKAGFFHKGNIKGEILDLSSTGASIQTFKPLEENITYSISCNFPYKHKKLPFSAKCVLKNLREYRNSFINGVEFTEIDPVSFENLKKYLKHLRGISIKDVLNP